MHGFYNRFLMSAESFPAATATELQCTSGAVESHTYAELRQMGESVGRWLRDRGVASGVRCAITASNGPLWVASYLGIMACGATSVPLDTAFTPEQVNKLLRDSGAAFIFTDAQRLPAVEQALAGLSVQIILMDGADANGGPSSYPRLSQMFAAEARDFKPSDVSDNDVAVILYTSGTTSDPKGVMLTHKNLLAEAEAVFDLIFVGPTDAILAVLPLFHSLAQMANLLLPLAAGTRIVYLESMNTTELLRALTERGITLFVCVPQFFYLIHERVMQQVKSSSWAVRQAFRLMMGVSAAGRKLGINLGKLFFRKVHVLLGPKMRFLVTGGSAFDAGIGRDLKTLGFNVLQAYGLTETSGAAFCTPPNDNVLGSVGRPLKGVEVKIVGEEPGEDGARPTGEIAIRGDIVMRGYYNRPDATAESIHDGWLHTGDLGYLDERNNLFITGRKKEMIVLSSGKNIFPEEIEAHYLRSPFISEICVMGLKNRSGEPVSERLHAVIVPNFDVLRERKIVNTREVIRFDVEGLSMQLPGTKRILSFDIWRDPLPRTTTRKLKRFEIQRRVMAGEGAEGQPSSAVEDLTAADALWLSDTNVQKAIAIIRTAGKAQKPVLPSSNLELDLGFDSMERVELVVQLERELGSEADDKLLSQVYTVRELVDTLLQARAGGASPAHKLAGWDVILATEPDDPKVIAALKSHLLLALFWFVVGKCVLLFVKIFFGLTVAGKENLPRKGPLILSPNHQSFLDGPIVAAVIPWRLFKNMFYVGTSEIFGRGILNVLGRTFRLVPVDPDSNLVNAMRAGAYGLKQGNNLVLYPEGERSIDGTPKKFKKGAAILSAHMKVPIYPVALEGFYDAWPRHRNFPRPAKLHVQFGEPIRPPDCLNNPEETYKQITETLRSRVTDMWIGLHENPGSSKTAAAAD